VGQLGSEVRASRNPGVVCPAGRDDLPNLLALYCHLNPEDPAVELTAAEAERPDTRLPLFQ
jgi:hypothetical protein